MLMEKEYTGPGYTLLYGETEEGVVITGFRGRVSSVKVPEQLEGKPVIRVDRKAFLSKKTLREIELPSTVRGVGDWAFAYCTNLKQVTLPAGQVEIGKTLFLDCISLGNIESYGWDQETGHLLAAAVTLLDANYLLDTAEAGSREWLKKWDARLFAVMTEEDLEGYQKQILCGEEDYGSTDVNAYLRRRRMKKVKLAMLRLLYSRGLSEEHREYLETYLREHTKGSGGEETWLVLWQEYPHDMVRTQLFLDLGCVNEENLEAILKDLGEEYPEMKARFLRYRDNNMGYQDFFEGLSL